MLDKLVRGKKIEYAFLIVFSLIIIVLFYFLISLNGLILGNDPAVHLAKAQIFLETGQVPLGNIGWIPPLFEILLAMIISLGGAPNIGQMIFIERAMAVSIDWLLFLSVYVVGSKFFNKKVGAVAAVFLALCYPLYELNTWGGYTTALGLVYLLLLLCYSYLAAKQFQGIIVTFFVAFAIVLSHQLTAFVAAVIMLPITLLMLAKFKGAYLKAFIATMIGGAIAFYAFYFPSIANYFGVAINHVFFMNETYKLSIPYTTPQYFFIDFGFILFLAVVGIGISYFLLKQEKKPIIFLTLLLSFFVPLFFAESYIFGFLLPFDWFMYYMMPPVAIFGAVTAVFIAEKLSIHFTGKLCWNGLKKAAVVLIAIVCCSLVAFQVQNIYSQTTIDVAFNSSADSNAYNAAVWLAKNYPDPATVVDTIKPGDWFSLLSGKNVISQTYDWEGANSVATSVLNLDYEIQTPQTTVKTYEAENYTTDELYVLINQIWYRVSLSSRAGDFLSFNQNGVNYSYVLSNLDRTLTFSDQSEPEEIGIRYFNSQVALTQTILVQNDSYPINVSWSISPLRGNISNVTLYLTTYFDLQFHFDTAQIPQLMDWSNPWDMQSKQSDGNEWSSVNFTGSDMVDRYVGLYDQQKQTCFGFNFTDSPDWVSIGALGNRQIDAVRYQYGFNEVEANQTVIRQYQELALSKDSFPTLQPNFLQSLFSTKTDSFSLSILTYKECIAENNIGFIVYDKDQFDSRTSSSLESSFLPQITHCPFLKLVYSNDRYDIFKILNNYNQTQVW